jgi:hypothetical protein
MCSFVYRHADPETEAADEQPPEKALGIAA